MHSFLSFNKNFLKLRVECKSVPNISKITSIQASCFMANLPYVCHKKQRLQNRALIKSFLQAYCKMSLFCSLFSVSKLKTQKIYGKFPWYEIHSLHIEYIAYILYSSRLSVAISSIRLKWNNVRFVPVCGFGWDCEYCLYQSIILYNLIAKVSNHPTDKCCTRFHICYFLLHLF